MAETFYGPWEITVVSRDAWFDQRIVVTGSDGMDGAYPGVPGSPPLRVTGAEWSLRMEWNDNAGSGWQPSEIRRAARYTVAEGLVVELGVDDNYEHLRDHDFNDVVIGLVSRDPLHTPLHPIVNPYDFTVPKKYLDEARRRQPSHPGTKDDQPPPHEPLTPQPKPVQPPDAKGEEPKKDQGSKE